jgi:hypothetical protein
VTAPLPCSLARREREGQRDASEKFHGCLSSPGRLSSMPSNCSSTVAVSSRFTSAVRKTPDGRITLGAIVTELEQGSHYSLATAIREATNNRHRSPKPPPHTVIAQHAILRDLRGDLIRLYLGRH